ncbi:MAG: hypothetical protein HPY50_16500 [Firmicutes bacterium]|nr:hypothetical protein [Bacillota bacterium]
MSCDPRWSFAEYTTRQTMALTHGYHKYPAKFIPPLAARLIEEYSSPGDLVGDPFMGSGTTLVESIIHGRRAVGVDINPIAWLISKVKTTPLEPAKLTQVLEELKESLPTDGEGRLIKAGKPSRLIHERIDYWFAEPNRSELEVVLDQINREPNDDIRRFLLCGFSNVLKTCSRWLMKSSKPTVDRQKVIPPLVPALLRQLQRMEQRNLLFFEEVRGSGPPAWAKVVNGDARSLPVKAGSIDLIVTSPPYVTSYEYADLHQLSNLVLGFATDLRELRQTFIGSVRAAEVEEVLLSPLAKLTVDRLTTANRIEGRGALTYFQSMQQCLREMHEKLKQGARACLVIGDTELKKVPVPNAEVFAETGERLGLELERVIKRCIPSKILPQTRDPRTGRFTSARKAKALAYPEEYILVMRKPKA